MKTLRYTASKLWKGVAVALFVALATVGTGAGSTYAATMVPIAGSFSGTVAFTGPTSVHFSGQGVATHLGRSQNDGVVTITSDDGSCPNGSDGLVNINVETLTAANGDNLVITSSDVACPIAPNVFHGTGHWVVNGNLSTGRFSGATGEGTLDGIGHFDVGKFEFNLTGLISQPQGS